MNNTLIIFIGGSGTGKTTTEQDLVNSGFAKSIVSHTTRKIRPGEKEGVHYYFTDVNGLKSIEQANEIKITDDWYYSVSKDELLKDHEYLIYSVINILPAVDLIKFIKDNNIPLNVIVIAFNISKEFRINKMKERGEKEEDILIRLNREDNLEDFEKFGIIPDYIESVMDPEMTNRIKDFICKTKKAF